MVQPFLSFGMQPLGNAFPRKEDIEREKRYPLELGYCPVCHLVQQVMPPPLEALQRDYTNYRYVPLGNTLQTHYRWLGEHLASDLQLGPTSFVVDIGSNDGLLLSHLREHNVPQVLGVEPAVEIAQIARSKRVETIIDFFTHEVAEHIVAKRGRADLVTLTQVLQHIPNLPEFLEDVTRILTDTGTLVVEGRYLGETVRELSWDSFYQEMLQFFSLHSIGALLETYGLEVYRAELSHVYGGSLRVYASRTPGPQVLPTVEALLQEEREWGLDRFETYMAFAREVWRKRIELRRLIVRIKKEGASIVGYGAPSTSATLLNACGIDHRYLDCVVDDSLLKQTRYTPGTHLVIVDPGRLTQPRPDYVLLLAWRLKEDILPKLATIRAQGTKVIVPLPEVEIL